MSQSVPSDAPEGSASLDGFRVEIDEQRQRADIVLDRPPLNVIRMRQRPQLSAAFAALGRNDAVRVVVLRAEGRHFSSGGDIPGFLDATPEVLSRLAENVMAPAQCQKPVIAAIQGYCFGVGFEFALACDFRIVTETARLALPEQKIGMIPGSGGSIRLLHLIGMARTKDLVMRARPLAGTEAVAWGVAIDCVADDQLSAAVDSLVDELLPLSPLAQRTVKGVLNAAQEVPMGAGMEIEGQAFARLRESNDFQEGIASFIDKRKPRFSGT